MVRKRRSFARRPVLIGNAEVAAAYERAHEMQLEIRRWLESSEKKRLAIQYSPEEQLRLLRLQVWSERYAVEVSEILDMILPTLRRQKHFQLHQRSHMGLGVSLPLLTGDWAEQILREELARHYPVGEQREIARERERERQLAVEAREAGEIPPSKANVGNPLDYTTPKEFLKAYERRAAAVRSTVQRKWNEAWRKRRAYRGSPWR